MSEDIFLDKIAIGQAIVFKQLNTIELYWLSVREYRNNPEIIKEHPTFIAFCTSLGELYDFLKNDYSKKLAKEDKKQLKDIMEKNDEGEGLDWKQAKIAKELIIKLMSLAKFNDLFRGGGKLLGLKQYEKRNKLSGGIDGNSE